MGADDKVFTEANPFIRLGLFFYDLIEKPVVWFRNNWVVPNRQEYYWYHEQVRRVPTIDECYTDDEVCMYEANEQYLRDRRVDNYIVKILQKRYYYCLFINRFEREECDAIKETYDKAVTNFFIKYGDLGWIHNAVSCLMKQKNRMAWERRHGPIGSGRKIPEEHYDEKSKAACS